MANSKSRQIPVFIYYEYDIENGKKYGKLYNWYAVNDSRGLAPKGYYIPIDVEWTILIDFLGGKDIAGRMMKSKTGWTGGGNGSNSSGFTGLPCGNCDNYGYFYNFSDYGGWWSSSEEDAGNALSRNLGYANSEVKRYINYKNSGLSVRCLKN
jgi:uncharacterized protein (TIGR02145 family)